MIKKALFIVDHLKKESSYLDTVIESSLEMQTILRERRAVAPPNPTLESNSQPSSEVAAPTLEPNPAPQTGAPPANNDLQQERNQQLTNRLGELRAKISHEFLPVLEGRRELVEVLNSIAPDSRNTPSVSALALKVDDPLRSELKSLRNEIRGKLNQVHSISMGNQAILIYTLDFYNRLLTGLSKDTQSANYYDATGNTQNVYTGSFVQTNC